MIYDYHNAWEDPEGGTRGLEILVNHKLLYIALKILVGTPFEKQLDPSGQIACQW